MDKNQLIAEFMEWNKTDEGFAIPDSLDTKSEWHTLHRYTNDELLFNKDWNWLMPVIDKLKSVTEEPEELDVLRDILWWGSIKNVYNSVVDNIQDYYERSKQ